MIRIILAIVSGVLFGSAFAGFYTNFEDYRTSENDDGVSQGILILHYAAIVVAIVLARPYLSMERTEQIIPFVVTFLTAILTIGTWILK